MLFSHISDLHLGLTQYDSEERENDIYDAFHQAIDISIKDHVDFVIFAGDLFHVPTPSGTAIIHMANALKRLKKNNIDSFFILGEHDISRIRTTPVPYVYHNLEFSKYIGRGNPVYYKDIMLVGFDKIRKSEMSDYEKKIEAIDSIAKQQHTRHRILVMHQGVTEINKFAGELNSTDLPKNFTYYAMGHLHDRFLKKFSHLGGPLAYPGSIELTTSEGIKKTKKGFYQVDISTVEAKPTWIKLNIRPQFSIKTISSNIGKTIDVIIDETKSNSKKSIIELKIEEDGSSNIEPDIIQAQISRLIPYTLHYSWRIMQHNNSNNSLVLMNKPVKIDEELFKIAVNSLKSEKLANFAVKELLPLFSMNQIDQANQVILENFEQFKKEKNR